MVNKKEHSLDKKPAIFIADFTVAGEALFNYIRSKLPLVEWHYHPPRQISAEVKNSLFIVDLYSQDYGYNERLNFLTQGYFSDVILISEKKHHYLIKMLRLPKLYRVLLTDEHDNDLNRIIHSRDKHRRYTNVVFSYKEFDVLRLLRRGVSINNVARELNICRKTIQSHKYNIMKKMEMKNNVEFCFFISDMSAPVWDFYFQDDKRVIS
ncbi:MAG: Bacterial regulatory protein luxR family [Proteobacteria bacterium]|nr:Bacterial regulatory protein luxR family [Pseudomonadota bacterium]